MSAHVITRDRRGRSGQCQRTGRCRLASKKAVEIEQAAFAGRPEKQATPLSRAERG